MILLLAGCGESNWQNLEPEIYAYDLGSGHFRVAQDCFGSEDEDIYLMTSHKAGDLLVEISGDDGVIHVAELLSPGINPITEDYCGVQGGDCQLPVSLQTHVSAGDRIHLRLNCGGSGAYRLNVHVP